jgi:hypothetical protein
MSMKKLRASNILYKYDIKAEEKFTNRIIIRQCLAEPDSRKNSRSVNEKGDIANIWCRSREN